MPSMCFGHLKSLHLEKQTSLVSINSIGKLKFVKVNSFPLRFYCQLEFELGLSNSKPVAYFPVTPSEKLGLGSFSPVFSTWTNTGITETF